MAQTRTCDACGNMNDDRLFSPGWGSLHGTDSFGQHVMKDLCPRCSAMMQLMLGELRRKFTTTGASSSSESGGAAGGDMPRLPGRRP